MPLLRNIKKYLRFTEIREAKESSFSSLQTMDILFFIEEWKPGNLRLKSFWKRWGHRTPYRRVSMDILFWVILIPLRNLFVPVSPECLEKAPHILRFFLLDIQLPFLYIYYSGQKESNNLHRDIVILRVLRGAELISQSAFERNIQPYGNYWNC